MLGPKRPRYSTIFLMDLRRDRLTRFLNPSAVPDDCIMRCIERRMCFKTAMRATGSSTSETHRTCVFEQVLLEDLPALVATSFEDGALP